MADKQDTQKSSDQSSPALPEILSPAMPERLEDLAHQLKVQELGEKAAESLIELLKAYEQINEKARNNQPVSAEEINDAEQHYDRENTMAIQEIGKELKRQVNRQLYDQAEKGAKRHPTILDPIMEFVENLTQTPKDPQALTDQWQSELMESTGGALVTQRNRVARIEEGTEPLTQAFYNQHVLHSSHHKNLALSPFIHNIPDFIRGVLATNDGMALADEHTRRNSSRFIIDNIALLKELGVDTIYMEFQDDVFTKIDKLSVPELKELAAKKHLGSIRISDAKGMARTYMVGHSDDTAAEWINMIAAAKENGIRVVNIDKKGTARDMEVMLKLMNHRIATTDFVWSDNIEKDRQAMKGTAKDKGKDDSQPLAEVKDSKDDKKDSATPSPTSKNYSKGDSDIFPVAAKGNSGNGSPASAKGGGKYIDYGGLGHFVNIMSRGLVDDALGLPVIAFDHSDANAAWTYQREWSPNGPDFYLPGGPDYLETQKMIRLGDIAKVKAVLEPMQPIFGVPVITALLDNISRDYEKDIIKSIDPILKKKETPEVMPKPTEPPNTPPPPPSVPGKKPESGKGL